MTSQVIETSGLDATVDVLSGSYAKIQADGQGQHGGMWLAQAVLTPAARVDHVRFTMKFQATVAPLGSLVFAELTAGRASYGFGRDQRAYQAGDLHLIARPDQSCAAAIDDADAELTILDPALLSQVAETAPGRSQRPVEITGYEPVSALAAQNWKRTSAYIRDVILPQADADAYALLARQTARLLAATALTTFPSNALTEPTGQDWHDAHPATLRRAVAFIDDNARKDITVANIAAACFVTTRAVQLAFRRHLDTTPLAYLRSVRLDHAHRDLLAADPARTTVTAVAYRWGFPSASRFSSYYRRAYGAAPAHTLRS